MAEEYTANGTDYSKMKLVYIAGKLNDGALQYLRNVHDMIVENEEVKALGVATYVPAIDLLNGIVCGYDDYHDYFDNGQAVLCRCDAVYVCKYKDYKTSKGTCAEIALAESLGIPVFYSLRDLKAWLTGQTTIITRKTKDPAKRRKRKSGGRIIPERPTRPRSAAARRKR